MKEQKSNELFLRPRFQLDIEKDTNQILEDFKAVLKDKECVFLSKFSDGHVIIDVPKNEAHFWSPQLNLEVVSTGENTSSVKGLFGPKPQVWTLFMFIHFVVGSLFIIFSIFFYVKFKFNESYTIPLIMLIFLPIIWVVLYFLGRFGKSTGHHQMEDLHELMMQVLRK